MVYTVRSRARTSTSGPHDLESKNRLCHNTTGGPVPRAPDVQPAEVGADEIGARVLIAPSIYFGNRNFGNRSILGRHGDVKRSACRTAWRSDSCWSRLLREFRHDLAAPRAEAGYGDVRDPHMQIFGNVRMGGVRLTGLADRAQLSLAATSELVNDLEEMGYLVRRPDPADGRAKLIDLTKRGRDAMADCRLPGRRHRAALVEARWCEGLRADVSDDAASA